MREAAAAKRRPESSTESKVLHSQRPLPRRRYVAPRVEKKRSVARVTLFSSGGTSTSGLTASG